MLAFPAAIRIYVALGPVDLRKSFNGLWAAEAEHLQEDPKSGAVFCFTNAEHTRTKQVYWDGTGVWLLAKRLEKGRFSWPAAADGRRKLAPEAFALLVGGVELKHGSLKPWYERKGPGRPARILLVDTCAYESGRGPRSGEAVGVIVWRDEIRCSAGDIGTREGRWWWPPAGGRA